MARRTRYIVLLGVGASVVALCFLPRVRHVIEVIAAAVGVIAFIGFAHRQQRALIHQVLEIGEDPSDDIMSEESAFPGVGAPAPMFALLSSIGQTVLLSSSLKEGPVVLYFYPKADTPGCTKQACGFRDAASEYKKAGAMVIGISPDPVAAVTKFAGKFKLNFPLLADEDHAVCEQYGVWQEKSMFGRKYWGALRTTFVIGKDGKIRHVFEKVKPEGHDELVLKWLNDNP